MKTRLPAISIRTRLLFLFTLQVVLILVGGGIYLNWQLRQTLEVELGNKLEHLARTAALNLDGDVLVSLAPGDESTRTFRNLQLQLHSLQQSASARRIYVFLPDRTSLLDTEPGVAVGSTYPFLPVTQTELDSLFGGGSVTAPLFTGSDGRLYKTAFAPIALDGEVVAALALEGSASSLEAIRDVRRGLLVLGLVVALGSVVLAFVFSGRLTGALNRLKGAAEKIAEGDYETPVLVTSRDEIGFLGNTMEEMRRAIVQRDRRQKAMLAGVAHEIRNPLGGIELFAGLLAAELPDPDTRVQAQKIQQEVQTLKRIVNDFLDYARPPKPKAEPCSVLELFETCKMLLGGEGREVTFEYSEEKPNAQVLFDPEHLRQIFLNLMKNAIQAMAGPGSLSLAVSVQNRRVRLHFQDSGPGIPPEIAGQIFEPFFTSRKNGTGLGLAIVRSLVEENGGEVRLLSGKPTTFELDLPGAG